MIGAYILTRMVGSFSEPHGNKLSKVMAAVTIAVTIVCVGALVEGGQTVNRTLSR
jgi:hypothetical protein